MINDKKLKIEIAGSAGSGKTTVTAAVAEVLREKGLIVSVNYGVGKSNFLSRMSRVVHIFFFYVLNFNKYKELPALVLLCLQGNDKTKCLEKVLFQYAINIFADQINGMHIQDQGSYYNIKHLRKIFNEKQWAKYVGRSVLPDIIFLLEVSESTKFRRKAMREKKEVIKNNQGDQHLLTKLQNKASQLKTEGYSQDEVANILLHYNRKINNTPFTGKEINK